MFRSQLVSKRQPKALFLTLAVFLLWTTIFSSTVAAGQPAIPPRTDYAEVAAIIKPFIEQQVAQKQLLGLYEFEWWHFDYKDWRKYPILNLTFEQLSPSPSKDAHL